MRISDWSSDVCSSDLVLSEENVERIAGTLENIESLTGSIADQREDLSALIVNARKASEQLNTTLDSTNRAISDIDREFVQKLPRSEEHTSELQSLMRISYAVFCLKKKIHIIIKKQRKKQLTHNQNHTT